MSEFNPLRFIADNGGMNIAEAIEKAYQQGRADERTNMIKKLFERLREVDADFISIDHLIEILEELKDLR